MKPVKQALSLALLGAGLVAVPGPQATAAAPAPQISGDSVVQKIKREAEGSVTVSREAATGKIGFVKAARGGDLMPSVKANSLATAVSKAGAYLTSHGTALGAGAGELKQSRVTTSRYGWTVSYEQRYRGVPVFGSAIRVNIDQAGDLTSVNGYAAPGLDLDVTPRLSTAEAGERAIATVRANPPVDDDGAESDTIGLKATSNTLSIYRLGSVKGERGRAVLVHLVEVTNDANVRDLVFIDANTGKPVNRYSLISDFETKRTLHERDISLPPVWLEGDPLPGSLNPDQVSIVEASGHAYWLFANAFQRDSWDGAGAEMVSVNNDPAIFCPNANWNGVSTNYCDGVSSDDVVAHEWAHAYTERTSDLIYQWQSGALNEAYSDIWGETVDLVNGFSDEGEGDLTAKRPVGQCSTHSPAQPLLTINTPTGIAQECATGGLLGTLDAPITGDVVAPTDAVESGGTATDGCSAYDDPAAAAGKIVLVDRGLCTFVQKAQVARDAGAAAVVIGDSVEAPVMFSDADQTLPTTVSIGLTNRQQIRTALANNQTVNVTIEDAAGQRVDSFRWLMGEKTKPFGGAIRDMWTPTCYGDPGKVSDAEYKCSADDSGGVHSNSGVPNHGYALLVDGGAYNGVTVPSIGLDKAANIFWRAQEAYLTPTSDFADLADGLEAACTALVGSSINKVSTNPNDSVALPVDQRITTADCAAVTAMTRAVELRQEPTDRCGGPLLAKGAPSVCGKRFKTRTVWKEDFQDGLKKWTRSQVAAGRGFLWRPTKDVPGRHRTKVAFAPDPLEAGSCLGDADDVTSVDSLRSQGIRLPGGRARRLSFQHYMASEAGWDGGNVKVSVNGAKFAVIPSKAYVFNPPNARLNTAAEGSTNPMAGQEAFTGSNGGVASGSWGKSIVNLNKVGAKKGDRIRLRFDMGRDGCTGNDGWYVDNVKVQVCKKKGKNRRAALGRRS